MEPTTGRRGRTWPSTEIASNYIVRKKALKTDRQTGRYTGRRADHTARTLPRQNPNRMTGGGPAAEATKHARNVMKAQRQKPPARKWGESNRRTQAGACTGLTTGANATRPNAPGRAHHAKGAGSRQDRGKSQRTAGAQGPPHHTGCMEAPPRRIKWRPQRGPSATAQTRAPAARRHDICTQPRQRANYRRRPIPDRHVASTATSNEKMGRGAPSAHR